MAWGYLSNRLPGWGRCRPVWGFGSVGRVHWGSFFVGGYCVFLLAAGSCCQAFVRCGRGAGWLVALAVGDSSGVRAAL